MFNELSYHNSAISSKNSHSYYWLNSYFCWLPQGKRAIHELSPWIITIIVPILSHINMDIVVNIGHTHIYIYIIYTYIDIRKFENQKKHYYIILSWLSPLTPLTPWSLLSHVKALFWDVHPWSCPWRYDEAPAAPRTSFGPPCCAASHTAWQRAVAVPRPKPPPVV